VLASTVSVSLSFAASQINQLEFTSDNVPIWVSDVVILLQVEGQNAVRSAACVVQSVTCHELILHPSPEKLKRIFCRKAFKAKQVFNNYIIVMGPLHL
jgi:hypothetical protein